MKIVFIGQNFHLAESLLRNLKRTKIQLNKNFVGWNFILSGIQLNINSLNGNLVKWKFVLMKILVKRMFKMEISLNGNSAK